MVSLYNVQRDRLLGKPSIESRYCIFCGRLATNKHHVIPKGMGSTKSERLIPTVPVCGMGNASGCHSRLHDGSLRLDWDDEADWWRYCYPNALDSAWKPVRVIEDFDF